MSDDSDASRLSARLIELEVRYTHQAVELKDLSDVIYRQQQEIERMRARLEAVEKKLADLSEIDRPTDPSDDVPPHY